MSERGRPEQREAFLRGAVAHVQAGGVATLSLRPLAAALGTSDRMLLYYFGSRDALVHAVLERAGAGLLGALDEALPAGRVPPADLLAALWAVAGSGAAEPALRLYVEVLGLAAARSEPFATSARRLAQAWLAALVERLDVAEAARGEAAAGVLATLDGLLLLRLAVDEGTADAAARWSLARA